MRKRHYLRGNRGTAIPQQIIAIDIDTTTEPIPHIKGANRESFRAAYISRWRDRGRSKETTDSRLCVLPERVWDFLSSISTARKCTTVLGVRMSRLLTLIGAWHKLQTGELSWTLDCPECQQYNTPCGRHRWQGYIITADPPFTLLCRFAGRPGTIKFLDLANFGAMPDNIPASGIARTNAILEHYLQWLQLVKDNDLGNAADTIGRQAWNSWRHRYDTSKVLVHDNHEILDLEREAYYGGRCEAKYVGESSTLERYAQASKEGNRQGIFADTTELYYQLDFTWHYPGIMRSEKFPRALAGFSDSLSVLQARRIVEKFCVIARLRINTTGNSYPVRRAGRTIYAAGRFCTTLSGPELSRALASGDVESVGLTAWYEPADLFSGWVDFLWELRQRYEQYNNICMAKKIKLLGDSLYGKFAQRKTTWKDSPEIISPVPFGQWYYAHRETGKLQLCRSIGWRSQAYEERKRRTQEIDPATGLLREYEYSWPEPAAEALPAIAAYITSYAREKLYDAISIAGEKNCYYCDTDALIVNSQGLDSLESASRVAHNELGKLRIVGVYDSISIKGYKNYRLGSKIVAGGFDTSQGCDHKGHYRYTNSETFRGVIGRKATNYVISRSYSAKITAHYQHGRVGPDGWVTPYILSE